MCFICVFACVQSHNYTHTPKTRPGYRFYCFLSLRLRVCVYARRTLNDGPPHPHWHYYNQWPSVSSRLPPPSKGKGKGLLTWTAHTIGLLFCMPVTSARSYTLSLALHTHTHTHTHIPRGVHKQTTIATCSHTRTHAHNTIPHTHARTHARPLVNFYRERQSGGQHHTWIRRSCGFDELSLAPQPNHKMVNNLNGIEWRLTPTRVTYELHPVLNFPAFDKTRLVTHSR